MSLLNLTNDGLPNVLVVLYATVARSKKAMSRDELLEAVAPLRVVHDDGKMARQTLNRWIELGLFVEDNVGIKLDVAPATALDSEVALLSATRAAARRCALDPRNNPDLWARQSAKAADLTRSLAWLLAQDVYRTTFQEVETLESQQVAEFEVRLMQNNTRRNGLQFWSHFLGFARQPGGGDIDPTVAILESLDQCLQTRGDGIPATDFVQRLGEVLPVLDGGAWRRAIELRLDAGVLPAMSEGQLSTSLSRALINLMLDEQLEFTNRADVGSSIIFSGRDGARSDYRYSWVRRLPMRQGGPR